MEKETKKGWVCSPNGRVPFLLGVILELEKMPELWERVSK